MKWIGQSVERLEDPPLVRGNGRFAGDIAFPHQLCMRLVRSNHAHGRIVGIDTSAALALRGVVAVWTAEDVADVPPIDFREGRIEKLEPYRQPILATGRVRFVGDPVAAVFATDPYVAEDAADLVKVEIEELPVVLDSSAPPTEFLPGRTTEADIIRQGYGDVDAALRAAPVTVELELAIGRHSGVPLETRGAIGRYDASRDLVELYGAAKVPHRIRELLSLMLKRPPSSIHIHEGHTGGGFGIRGELYPEDVLVCVAAMRLRRPVKWIEDRREHLITANHSRQQLHRIRAGVDHDGQILAIDDEYFHDQGGYVRTHATRVVHMTAGILPGPYRVPAYRSVGHFRLTNKTPAATYRAPGRYETTFVRERLVHWSAFEIPESPCDFNFKHDCTFHTCIQRGMMVMLQALAPCGMFCWLVFDILIAGPSSRGGVLSIASLSSKWCSSSLTFACCAKVWSVTGCSTQKVHRNHCVMVLVLCGVLLESPHSPVLEEQ